MPLASTTAGSIPPTGRFSIRFKTPPPPAMAARPPRPVPLGSRAGITRTHARDMSSSAVSRARVERSAPPTRTTRRRRRARRRVARATAASLGSTVAASRSHAGGARPEKTASPRNVCLPVLPSRVTPQHAAPFRARRIRRRTFAVRSRTGVDIRWRAPARPDKCALAGCAAPLPPSARLQTAACVALRRRTHAEAQT
jgi:hypothetical protein